MKKGCDYQGYEFGANYKDSVCVKGQLYDADRCDSQGNLYEGVEEIPCPKCNHEDWLNRCIEQVEEEGWIAFNEGQGLDANPFRVLSKKIRFEKDRTALIEAWKKGWSEANDEEVRNETP